MSDSGAEHLLFIAGRFEPSESGMTIPLVNSSGKVIGSAAQAGEPDTIRASQAARGAFPQWSSLSGYARGARLLAIARSVEKNAPSIVAALIRAGVSRRQAEREAISAADLLAWYAGWCDKFVQVYGSVNSVPGPYFSFTVPEPIGVVGLVAPSEPVLLGTVSRLAPALVAGNTLVVLASERVASPIDALANSIGEAQLPDGIVNILFGDTPDLVTALVSEDGIDGLDFSGDQAQLRSIGWEGPPIGIPHVGSRAERGPELIGRYCQTKGIWHSTGK